MQKGRAMDYGDDPRLTNVSAEVKRLEREVSDAEWDNDPRLAALAQELRHYKELQEKGILYEPTF
jgi:hypothetical protein